MKVRDQWDRVEAVGGTAVAIVGDVPEAVRAGMLHDLTLPFPVLVDPERASYRAWGLRRTSVVGAWGPRRLLGYVRMLRAGETLLRPGADTLQLGGDFVLDAHGRVAYSHPQERSDERPPVGVLLRELARAAGA